MCSNAVTKVQNKRVLATLINPTEEAIKLKTPNFKELVHEEFKEALIHSVQVTDRQAESHADSSQLRRLEEALRTDHLNSEERESILAICQDYSDIFFLEGDRVLATTAITHKIKTSEAILPIHVKPYRLPQKHRLEITDQMEAFEREGVIAASESPTIFGSRTTSMARLNKLSVWIFAD